MNVAFLIVGALLAQDPQLSVELSPLNGTNRLLVDEVVYVFVTYRNDGAQPTTIYRTEQFEVARKGSGWQLCTGLDKVTSGLVGSSFRHELAPGEAKTYYFEALRFVCPDLTKAQGVFEIRVVENSSRGRISSLPQRASVEEPVGLDAAALAFLREKEQAPGFQPEFLERFAGTAYAARYILSRPPTALKPRLDPWARAMERDFDRGQLSKRSKDVQQFVARNPEHLFSPLLRRELVVMSSVLGDVPTLTRTVRDMEARGADAVDAEDAQRLLERTQGPQVK